MPPALGDFDTAHDDATPGQMASSLPERPAGLWLTRSSGGRRRMRSLTSPASSWLLRADLSADLTVWICSGSNNDVQVARLEQGK